MMGDQTVDINVATVEELETLMGVGRAKAEAIVKTRTVSFIYLYIYIKILTDLSLFWSINTLKL